MSKLGIFMANGCEEIEGLTVVDIARRAGIEIDTISITGENSVTSSHNVTFMTDTTKEKADFCMDFAQGNLGKAIRLATSEEYKEIIEDVTGVLRKIPDMTVDDIMFAIKNMNHHKLKISDYIDLMMMWYRDILMLKITGNAGRLMFKEYYTDIRKQSAHISYEGIEDVLKAMDKAKIRLEANVNFDVAMELMLLTIKENK